MLDSLKSSIESCGSPRSGAVRPGGIVEGSHFLESRVAGSRYGEICSRSFDFWYSKTSDVDRVIRRGPVQRCFHWT